MRKDLCAEGLIRAIRNTFSKIKEERQFARKCSVSLTDALMSCFAVFSLKWPSLLQYENEKKDPIVLKNFQTLYLVGSPPSDTYMRERLDEIDPIQLRPAFKKLFSLVQRGKALEQFQYLDGYYLFSSDGTGYFNSHTVHCPNCCVKHHYDGKKTYYHNMMGGAIVHPDKKEVIPFCPEPIILQDGKIKNDCEQNASKRQLEALRKEHPHLKIIVVQDALSDSGPNVRLLESLSMKYIIVTKNPIFQWEKPSDCSCHVFQDEDGNKHTYRFINGMPLNGVNLDVKVNAFEHTFISPKGEERKGAWITNIQVTRENVHQLMQGGRARWKIENETFNTLKNQGYHFEHNFGHGDKNLSTVMCFLMMLAFFVDQTQLLCCHAYQEARRVARTFHSLWEKMRTFFTYLKLDCWEQFFGLISKRIFLDTS